MRVVIDVRIVEPWRARLRRWFVALWWPALLLAQVALVIHGTRYTDDGDPTVRFKTPWDLAYVLILTAALTLEARELAVRILTRRARFRPPPA